MSELGIEELYDQIDMLSYFERLRLLDKVIQTLHTPEKNTKKVSSDFSAAFGLWRDRDVSLEDIRSKAWGRC